MIIAISDGSGTLAEIAIAYQATIPVVTLKGFGSWSDKLSGTFLDARQRLKCQSTSTVSEEVALAIATIERI